MKFYSTADKSNLVSLREAVLSGMPNDNGLYMPESIPRLPESFFKSMTSMDYQSLSFEIARQFLSGDIPASVLQDIIHEAINFPTPLVDIEDRIKTLELFHGPTLAFKDVGARFMSRLMAYLVKDSDHKLTILVATSGDTGGAVANGFYRVPGIDVIVLYPAGKISLIQEKQMATLGENITDLKVNGTFDDCQRLVKAALVDPDIKKSLMLTSANSINIFRLIPQTFYYFNALRQIENFRSRSIVISVPSGNFGNLTAGLIAKRMGLPVQRFIAATNVNHVVPDYLNSGKFEPKPSIQTISNAMDVGNPSNFSRILDLYDSSWKKIKEDIQGVYFTDDETRQAITSVKKITGYTLDPHGAVGYLGLKKYLTQHQEVDTGLFLETAHPAKFKDIVEPVIQDSVEIPERLADFLTREIQTHALSNQYTDFKEFLLTNSN
ncbi:threonine synthase [bacterium]|nr:threonine synthase [bacterium]